MKIALVYDGIYPFVKGGADKRYYEISKYLAEKGHEVHVFTMRWWGSEKMIIKDGVTLHGVCRPGRRYVKGRRSISEVIRFALALFPALLRQRFDVIECSEFPCLPCLPAKIVSMLRKSALVIGWWECWGNYWYEYLGNLGFIGKWVERKVKDFGDKIIVETEYNKELLSSWGADRNKIIVIPSGAHFHEIQTVAKAEEEVDVIFVGRLVKIKGVHTLIEAIACLKREGKRVTLGIVGEGPERGNLQRLVQKWGLDERVRFYGSIEEEREMISVMKSAKVFVYPAAMEGGWALSGIEANACGLPVISVRSGPLGVVEAVIDGYNGLLAEEQSPQLIAEKISLALDDDNLRENLRRNALNFAQNYDWYRQAQRVEKVYESVAR